MCSINDLTFTKCLNSLARNEKLSKKIEESIAILDRRFESLKDSKDYLLSQIEEVDDNENEIYASQFVNGQNMRPIRKPYFTNNRGLIPFTNHIEKQRQIDGSFEFYSIKKQLSKICTEKDFDILKNAISRHIYDIEYATIRQSKCRNMGKKAFSLKKLSVDDLIKRCDESIVNKIDWLSISSIDLNGRVSDKNCRNMYENLINPQYVYTKWTEAENQELLTLATELGCQRKWTQISARLTVKRQPLACFKQWLELSKKLETSEEWSSKEDEFLCEVVKNTKDKKTDSKNINWNKVSLLVPNRSSRDCERRWNSIQVPTHTRPFTDADDYKMLLLIKRLGSENWAAISQEMDNRTIEECQRRYCVIVDELSEWTYIEDRKLWLILRPYFIQLWENEGQCLKHTADLTIFKSVMKGFNGRCPLVIRYRYSKLCKSFYLWNMLYFQANGIKAKKSLTTMPLLSESLEENSSMKNFVRIIINSSLFDIVRESFIASGSKNPDKDANELITIASNGSSKKVIEDLMQQSENRKLMRLICFIIDIRNGIFIPIKYEDYLNRSCTGLKYPDRAQDDLRIQSTNVRIFESKVAITKTLRNRMNEMLNNGSIKEDDRECISKLLNCEGKFTSAFNYATTSLEKDQDFKFVDKTFKLMKLVPDILSLMMDYVFNQEHQTLSIDKIRVQSDSKACNKKENIAELLIYRDLIPSIYKTYLNSEKKGEFHIGKYIPKTLLTKLASENNHRNASKKILQNLRNLLKYPAVDSKIIPAQGDQGDIVKDMTSLLPPNRVMLHFLRNLLLQKSQLLSKGKEEFFIMNRLRYDNPVDKLRNDKNNLKTPLSIDNSSILLLDPKYKLLRSRFISILAVPTVIARISPFASAVVADKLYEQQNEVQSSSFITESFNSVKPTLHKENRKRKVRDCVEQEFVTSPIKKKRSEMKISENKPLTRYTGKDWVKLSAPDSGRHFFVSKFVLKSILNNNFEIQSINGVEIEKFVE